MKKTMLIVLCVAFFATTAFAANAAFVAGQWSTTVPGGVTATAKGFSIDKLGAHQNGGRGCVGCHTPHSGGRGNGGAITATSVFTADDNSAFVAKGGGGVSGKWSAMAADSGDVMGDEVLWGQDLGPIYGHTFTFNDNPDNGTTGAFTIAEGTSQKRMVTGVAMCLSCHDGNVAKGAMMTNQSFEQAAGMLPKGYGSNVIPTLLGNDGGSTDNYLNDHPVGPNATLGSVGHGAIGNCDATVYSPASGCTAKNFFQLGTGTSAGTIVKGTEFSGSQMEEFYKNYGLPVIIDARAGAGWAVESYMTTADQAYVVCTTCHTPHSMYTATAKLNGVSKGTVPSFFFIAAAYNPGANVASGTKASSATQFCRQCHFSGPGGANEASGISIPTAF